MKYIGNLICDFLLSDLIFGFARNGNMFSLTNISVSCIIRSHLSLFSTVLHSRDESRGKIVGGGRCKNIVTGGDDDLAFKPSKKTYNLRLIDIKSPKMAAKF